MRAQEGYRLCTQDAAFVKYHGEPNVAATGSYGKLSRQALRINAIHSQVLNHLAVNVPWVRDGSVCYR